MSDTSEPYRPPTPPSRTASAPAVLQFGAASPSSPTTPPTTITQHGPPDESLGMPGDDITTPNAFRTLDSLITALLQPPPKTYRPQDKDGKTYKDCVRLDMQWVKAAISEKHFFHDAFRGRSVLRHDSKIRTHGLQYGLPKAYYTWLCGEDVLVGRYKVTKEQLWMRREDFRRQDAGPS